MTNYWFTMGVKFWKYEHVGHMTDQLTQQDIPVISVKDHICIVRSLFMADELLTLSLPNETAVNVCVLFCFFSLIIYWLAVTGILTSPVQKHTLRLKSQSSFSSLFFDGNKLINQPFSDKCDIHLCGLERKISGSTTVWASDMNLNTVIILISYIISQRWAFCVCGKICLQKKRNQSLVLNWFRAYSITVIRKK